MFFEDINFLKFVLKMEMGIFGVIMGVVQKECYYLVCLNEGVMNLLLSLCVWRELLGRNNFNG